MGPGALKTALLSNDLLEDPVTNGWQEEELQAWNALEEELYSEPKEEESAEDVREVFQVYVSALPGQMAEWDRSPVYMTNILDLALFFPIHSLLSPRTC